MVDAMVGVQVAAEAANNASIGPVTEFGQSVTSQALLHYGPTAGRNRTAR